MKMHKIRMIMEKLADNTECDFDLPFLYFCGFYFNFDKEKLLTRLVISFFESVIKKLAKKHLKCGVCDLDLQKKWYISKGEIGIMCLDCASEINFDGRLEKEVVFSSWGLITIEKLRIFKTLI